MTREEAIRELKIQFLGEYDRQREAKDIAIKALEQEPRPMEKFESVKDHIYKLAGDYKCWDNRLTDDEALELYHILEQELCEDAVSRKAIEKLKRWRLSYDNNTTIPKSDLFVKLTDLRDLSSVTPIRKKAKWIKRESATGLELYYQCSNCSSHCLYEYVEIGFQNAKTKFCPNCGAEMEVEE